MKEIVINILVVMLFLCIMMMIKKRSDVSSSHEDIKSDRRI